MGWAFTAPALLVIAAVTIFPIVYSVVMSFNNVTVTGNGFSLDGFTFSNYNLLIHASLWRDALYFTLYYTMVTVVVELILGTCIALVLERLAAGRGWMMALLLIPWSMITVINAELWAYIYNGTYGVADYILNGLGLGSPVILGTPTPAIIGLMIADIWKTTPFVAIIVLAGLVMLPRTSTRRPRWTAPPAGPRSGTSPCRCCGRRSRSRSCSGCCRPSACSTCPT